MTAREVRAGPVSEPRLHTVSAPADPEGVVLVLHGGRDRGHGPVRANQLAVLRMVPIARRITVAGRGRLAVVRLQNRVRGWNGAEQSPVHDADWAIAELRRRYDPALPLALIGHSMGARAALRVAGRPGVRTVVALAPWLPPGEPTNQLAGRRVLIVHGSADRMTSARSSAQFATGLRDVAGSATFVEVPDEKHAMLGRREVFEELPAGFVAATLLEPPPAPEGRTASGLVTNLLQRALAGDATLVA